MKQYHQHLQDILEKGTVKPAAREGMPRSISLFGYQNRYNLQDGFPILTTKRVSFKNIVVELLWFLKGDTNIKYLIDNGCNIWNQDAYNYYNKIKNNYISLPDLSFSEFINKIKEGGSPVYGSINSENNPYKLGDCGFQYGKVWRGEDFHSKDQLQAVINSLKNSPQGRRHLVSAIDPLHDDDLALYWCHCLFQFNARPLNHEERLIIFKSDLEKRGESLQDYTQRSVPIEPYMEYIPKYYLDCHMYQRSADMFLGVPYNISSYALLTHIIASICNMVPGEFIHSFGDSHIYDNHMDQVKEILKRDTEKYSLPELKCIDTFWYSIDEFNKRNIGFDQMVSQWDHMSFALYNYKSYPNISAKLSTGLK